MRDICQTIHVLPLELARIFILIKKFLDLSLCAGTLILGHNSNIFKKSIKDVTKKYFKFCRN